MREEGKVKSEELRMKSKELKFDDEKFLEQYLAGKAPLHGDRLNLPSEEELDAAEAEFDKIVTAHKRPARLLPLWPWVGAAIAAMLVAAFLLWSEKPTAVPEEQLAQVTAPKPVKQPKVAPVPQPHSPHEAKEAKEAHKPQASSLTAPMPQPKEEETPVIPPDKQALADIFLAEEALQVAYELQAQQEAIRAYAASLTEEELPQPIIAF